MKNDDIIIDFASKIDYAQDFNACFDILTKAAENIGFDGVLYTYTPLFFIDEKVDFQPIMRVSDNFGMDYLTYYQENNFIEHDHMVQGARRGEDRIANWFHEADTLSLSKESKKVLETARKFGIRNGLSCPVLLTEQAFAGASFICRKNDDFFNKHCVPYAELMRVLAKIFHHKVISDKHYQQVFILPFLQQLSRTKVDVLKRMSGGQNIKQISTELGRNHGYIQNLIGEIRHDFGDVPRDRLMYLVGILNIDAIF